MQWRHWWICDLVSPPLVWCLCLNAAPSEYENGGEGAERKIKREKIDKLNGKRENQKKKGNKPAILMQYANNTKQSRIWQF